MRLDTQKKRGHFDAGPNLLPVVNIAMVVLIVFMIGASFTEDFFLQSRTPITQTGVGGKPPPPGFIPDEPLDIRLDSPSPERFIARVGQYQFGDPQSLATQLVAMREQFEQRGIELDKIQVRISPGRDVQYKYLIAVYEAAMKAEFSKIGFTTAH